MFQIHLSRSHFDQIAVAAANTARPGHDPTWGGNGWCTKYDGDERPNKFVALYACGAFTMTHTGGLGRLVSLDQDYSQPTLFALVLKWPEEGRCRESLTFLRRKFPADKSPELTNGGLDAIQSAYDGTEGWEQVAPEVVPANARDMLEKSITVVRGLFGQGKDFFAR